MKKGKIIWAILLIAIALLILGSGFGVLPVMSGKLLATLLLGAFAIRCLWGLEFWGLFFSLAVIGIIYAQELQIESITPWPILGAALLLSIGFSMLFGKQAAQRRREHHSEWSKQYSRNEHYRNAQGEEVYDTSFGEHSEEVNGEMLHFENHFGASSKYVTSDNFKSAVLNNSFGEMKVYFDNAMMQQETATIDVNNSFGETQIYIPKSWKTELKLHSALGAVTEKNHPQPDGQHTVVLTGSNSMGEVQILYI